MSSAISASQLDFKSIALPLAQRGIHVVPTYPGLSKPLLDRWELLATTDPVTIEESGSNGYANYNCVSIAKFGGVGMVEIDDLEAAFKRGMPKLPPTFTVQSPGGNNHLHAYFQSTPESDALGNLCVYDENGKKIVELKANNQGCCSPGSFRKDEKYPNGAWYQVKDDLPIGLFRTDWLAWMRANGKGKKAYNGLRRELHPDFDREDFIEHHGWEFASQFDKDGADYRVFGTCVVCDIEHPEQVKGKKCCLVIGGKAGIGVKSSHHEEWSWGDLKAKLENDGIEPYPGDIFADDDPEYYLAKWPGGIEDVRESSPANGIVSAEELRAFLAEPEAGDLNDELRPATAEYTYWDQDTGNAERLRRAGVTPRRYRAPFGPRSLR